jgi:hypothetical protein
MYRRKDELMNSGIYIRRRWVPYDVN